jgi:hypothetical protein
MKVREKKLELCETPIPSYTIIVCKWGHDFLHCPPLPTNPLGCTLNMWCLRKLTLLASFFGAKLSLTPSGNPILIWAYARKFHLSHAISSDIHYVHDAIFWKFLAFISLATWHGTFMQFPPPLKKKSCSHFTLHFLWFFATLLWNSFMASWACSMSNSFINQGAPIKWYLFHLINYFRFRPFSCFNLITSFTSNLGSLSIRSGGGLELYSWLGVKASKRLVSKMRHEIWDEP